MAGDDALRQSASRTITTDDRKRFPASGGRREWISGRTPESNSCLSSAQWDYVGSYVIRDFPMRATNSDSYTVCQSLSWLIALTCISSAFLCRMSFLFGIFDARVICSYVAPFRSLRTEWMSNFLTMHQYIVINSVPWKCLRIMKQAVVLTGRNTTGPHVLPPGELRCICAVLQMTTDDNGRHRPLLI